MRFLAVALALVILPVTSWTQEMVFVSGDSYPPLCYFENGATHGIEIDFMKELAARAGFTVRFRAIPWARAQKEVETGEADAFITISTPERERYVTMSKEVFTLHLVAATSVANPRIQKLRSIQSLSEAVKYTHVNYIGTSLAKSILVGANVNYLKDAPSIFQFLIGGRADLFLDTDVIIYYNTNRLGITDKIEILPPVFEATEFRLGISKRSPFAKDIPKLNALIQQMHDGTIEKILKKYGWVSKSP